MSKDYKPETAESRKIVREFEILNRYGIHARPAALFVKTASKFVSSVTVEKDGIEISGKSIMGLLTLEGFQGAVLKVTAQGPDANEAVDAIQELFENRFYEE